MKYKREQGEQCEGWVVILTVTQYKTKISRDGHLTANISIWFWVMLIGWSCNRINSLNRFNYISG